MSVSDADFVWGIMGGVWSLFLLFVMVAFLARVLIQAYRHGRKNDMKK